MKPRLSKSAIQLREQIDDSYPSWTLNSDTYFWEAPTPMPTDGKFYEWDEATTSWVEVPTL